MTKVVINGCHGGFGLSEQARDLYQRISGEPCPEDWDLDRTNAHLVTVVEALGEQADARYARLKVVEVPDEVQWTIEDYDGVEWVAELHRTWS